jgi:hypothetical protein
MIKQGEVAFLKTTGEAVFVRSFRDPSPKLGDKDLVVEVRRPVMGQDGVRHVVEEFQLAELESLDEQRAKFMAERHQLVEKYGPKAESLPTDTDPRFGTN